MRTAAGAGPVRGLVFDLDGTLIDSYEAIGESLNHALSTMGYEELPADRVRSLVGRGLEILIRQATGGGDDVTVARGVALFRQRYDRICESRTRLLPGVLGTLETLSARGYPMAVATNKPSYFARRILDALGAGRAIELVVGPDLVAHPKPHPEMLLAALDRLRVPPADALYVGDMEIDIQTARAAGVRVVVVPTGSRGAAELALSGADRMLPRFSALLGLLDRIGDPLLESNHP
ncbi:MAG TPA: HAD-IA family hydrolase [Candidatus Polarisedimenticolia bacterium]|nr:HAD-IA family hydrolase [Candidatus Polarisedimenticolia bacterium]